MLQNGVANPYDAAADVIAELEQVCRIIFRTTRVSCFENPLLPIMQDTPLGPTTLNLPRLDQQLCHNLQAASQFSNLTTQQKFDLLFPDIWLKNALQKIESHEKLCRIMQKQTHDKIHKLENQINRVESIY